MSHSNHLSIKIEARKVRLVLDRSLREAYCRNVLNTRFNQPEKAQGLYYLGAAWLHNQLVGKTASKSALKIPMEYGILLINYCRQAYTWHDLEQVALYTIQEQLNKQINP